MSPFVQVAVPAPVYRLFDYRWPYPQSVVPGIRVVVPFGRRSLTGILVQPVSQSEVPVDKLRAVSSILDDAPLLSEDSIKLLEWASRYYHHPIGQVLSSALPVRLRQAKPAKFTELEFFQISDGTNDPLPSLSRSPIQRQLLEYLADRRGQWVPAERLRAASASWRQAVNSLIKKGLVDRNITIDVPKNIATHSALPLGAEQQTAVEAITNASNRFRSFLLQGVTGSGKTEVYLHCINHALKQGLQCLVIVPEIALTPQLMKRFEQRLNGRLVTLHSALNDTERMQHWLGAARGMADVVVGTRSSVLTPMPRLGLIIVDEEHDGSLKQQDGFRYHARDMAIMRAHIQCCPVVLGSATPSLESLHNVVQERMVRLRITQRAGQAKTPSLGLLDIRRCKLTEGLSERLLIVMREHLQNNGQVMVFVNQRGFAPTLLCNDCGGVADCRRCDAHMTVHLNARLLRCHHCGAERQLPTVCEVCKSDNLDWLGYGTQRITEALVASFPEYVVARIDRDSTRRKGELELQLAKAVSGEASILVGTQMLAKGHHFPHLSLVCVLDADRGLFSVDFRALEHMAQLIIQVAGRAGREAQRGEVLIQTRHPEHPMLLTLIQQGYEALANYVMEDRERASLPPYHYLALVRSEASRAEDAHALLNQIAHWLRNVSHKAIEVHGPATAPMERVGGRYRAQLLIQANKRSSLNNVLSALSATIDQFETVRRCRWSIDVDPVDMY